MDKDKDQRWPEQQRALTELLKHYTDYFMHKERLCHAIILIEVPLAAFMFVLQIPKWYSDWVSNLPIESGSRTIAKGLTFSIFIILLFFSFCAHRLLIMQLGNRKVADAVGDGIRVVLAKWSFADFNAAGIVKIRQSAMASLRDPKEVDKYFEPPPAKSYLRAFFEKNIYPLGPSKPSTNTDDIWPHLPKEAVKFASAYFKRSHARPFEKTLLIISLILLAGACVGFGVRLHEYFFQAPNAPLCPLLL